MGRDLDGNRDAIGDHLSDIFIHNNTGTAMIGINEFPASPEEVGKLMGLTWMDGSEIMMKVPKILVEVPLPRKHHKLTWMNFHLHIRIAFIQLAEYIVHYHSSDCSPSYLPETLPSR